MLQRVYNTARSMTALKAPAEVLLRNAARTTHIPMRAQETSASGSTYRAAVVAELGKPVTVVDLPRKKTLDSGEVRVAVHNAGVNFADILMAQGKYQQKPPLPFVLGSELAGEVLEIADDVDNVKVGDRVFGMTSQGGSYSEEVIINEMLLGILPPNLDTARAASFITAYGTAYLALTRGARIKKGDVVLVTAAAGATGLAAVDLAANVFECEVIAACSSEEKLEVARRKGATHTINYSKDSLKDRMKEITGGDGANIIFEIVGGKLFRECLSSIAFEGTILPIGFAGGDIPNIPANLVLVKNINISGVFWGSHSFRNPEAFQGSLNTTSQYLKDGKIKPEISKIFPLSKVNDAFEHVMSRKSAGKVLIDTRT